MSAVYIKMLGKFDILVNGESVLPFIGNSSKSILLLKYLLLSKGKPVPVSALIDTFWSETEKSANPENALKTMVSRIRSNMAKASDELKNCILSESKAYSWNMSLDCEIDVFTFETLCKELMETEGLDNGIRSKYVAVMDLYGGDLSYMSSDEDRIISRSLYLHHIYLQVVYRFINCLKNQMDYDTIIQVCRIALDIDTFDEQINLELMAALKEGGQNNVALMQYHHITSAYYKYLGIEPSEKIQGFYKNLIQSDLAAETDISTIKQSLKQAEKDGGAFICDYSIFKDIYQLQLRNMERKDNRMFLSLLSVLPIFDERFEPLVLAGIMRELLEILKKCLRKGDTISRYSTSQYAILLPMGNYSNGNIVINRIKKMFYKIYPDNTVKLTFQFGSLHQEQADKNTSKSG